MIRGLERELTRLTKLAAAMADNTKANAEIAKVALEQSVALVDGQRDLHSTTRAGIRASELLTKVNIGLGVVLVDLTVVIAMLTWVLVLRTA